MEGISFQEVLSPYPGQETWDYALYGIIALALVAVILSSTDTKTLISIFVGYALVAAIIDKTYAVGFIVEPEGTPHAIRVATHLNTFWVVIMRALMFALPAVAAFQTENGKIAAASGLLAFVCLIYTLGRWFDAEYENLPLVWIIHDPQTALVQGSAGVLLLGDLARRGYRRWLGGIDRL